MAPHMSNDEFFSSLSALLSTTSQKSRGSVYLSQKRLSSSSSTTTTTHDASSEEGSFAPGSILIRATDGKTGNPNPKSDSSNKSAKPAKASKLKISTIVAPDDIEAFYVRYAEVCKAGMTGMKKRDRSAKKKGKAKGKSGAAATQAGKVTKP